MALEDRAFPIVWRLAQEGQKYYYGYVTRRVAARDFLFLNHGYEEDPPMAVPLATSDERNRFCIQLYHRTATQADLSGKRVLEVSCGHGGGASYLMRTFHPVSYTGLDLNLVGIAFCRKRHTLPGLDFVHGDAENLPFPDQSFDAVINVVAALHYPRFPRFLAEVARVLRPGGHFLYVDARWRVQIPDWEAALANAPMRMLSHRDINAEVMRGMERNSYEWPYVTDGRQLRFLFGLPRDKTRVQDSQVYQGLQSGRLLHRMYCFANA